MCMKHNYVIIKTLNIFSVKVVNYYNAVIIEIILTLSFYQVNEQGY